MTRIEFLNPHGWINVTSRSMIFVTPDGERSMNTYLGISAELGSDDVQDEFGSAAKNVFLSYLPTRIRGKRPLNVYHVAAAQVVAKLVSPFQTRFALNVTAKISLI